MRKVNNFKELAVGGAIMVTIGPDSSLAGRNLDIAAA
jgi:hypothetical protein